MIMRAAPINLLTIGLGITAVSSSVVKPADHAEADNDVADLDLNLDVDNAESADVTVDDGAVASSKYVALAESASATYLDCLGWTELDSVTVEELMSVTKFLHTDTNVIPYTFDPFTEDMLYEFSEGNSELQQSIENCMVGYQDDLDAAKLEVYGYDAKVEADPLPPIDTIGPDTYEPLTYNGGDFKIVEGDYDDYSDIDSYSNNIYEGGDYDETYIEVSEGEEDDEEEIVYQLEGNDVDMSLIEPLMTDFEPYDEVDEKTAAKGENAPEVVEIVSVTKEVVEESTTAVQVPERRVIEVKAVEVDSSTEKQAEVEAEPETESEVQSNDQLDQSAPSDMIINEYDQTTAASASSNLFIIVIAAVVVIAVIAVLAFFFCKRRDEPKVTRGEEV